MISLFKEVIEMLDGFLSFPLLTSYQEVKPEFEPPESHSRSIVPVCVEGNPQMKKAQMLSFLSAFKKKKKNSAGRIFFK